MTASAGVHLVTGGSGFMGTLIVERLRARGHRVRSLDIHRDPAPVDGVDCIVGDVRDRATVARCMRDVEVVHHAAALVPLTKSGAAFHAVNVDGSRIVAEEAARAGAARFVHISSSAVYGVPPCPITRATPTEPVEIYGHAKLAGERAVQEACDAAGLPLLIIRPRTILGRGRLGLYQFLFEWIREGRDFYVIGSGHNRFQYVQADDLMDAWQLLLDHGRTGAFAVGTDRFGTFRESLETLIQHAGTASRVRSLPARPAVATLRLLDRLRLSPLAPWHYLTSHVDFYCDVQPLLDLGWRPRYSNDAMLAACYDWFLAHPDTVDGGSPHRSALRQGVLRVLKRLS